jgi:hypothetical protein
MTQHGFSSDTMPIERSVARNKQCTAEMCFAITEDSGLGEGGVDRRLVALVKKQSSADSTVRKEQEVFLSNCR